jgi:membrane protein involved in colicin uptake
MRVLLVALLIAGCGREDVELVPGGDGGAVIIGDGGMCDAP